jgi:hypothetical protein
VKALVSSFAELASRAFVDGVNALCWPRRLHGDFAELAHLVAPSEGMIEVDRAMLRTCTTKLSAAGRVAADTISRDLDALLELGCEPTLSCVVNYRRDERELPIATDVMSFHADRAEVEVDTWLCTYSGKSSEGLDNAGARKLIDVPTLRARLLQQACGGEDDASFADFIREGSFDLHYDVVDGARPFSFGVGNLWRIAVDWPGARVLPCIHRAPETAAHDEPRLLLIS